MAAKSLIQIIHDLIDAGFQQGYVTMRADNGLDINNALDFKAITESDIINIDAENNVDLEKAIHLTVYAKLTDVNIILHLRPEFVSAIAAMSLPLYAVSLPDADSFGYKLPLCLNNIYQVVDNLSRYGIALTKNKGIYLCGSDVKSLVREAVMIENAARNYLTALALGEPRIVPPHIAKKQHRLFKTIDIQ